MSKFKDSYIDRSHNFGGHLNKKWIMEDLPRYQLAYSELSADLFKNTKLLQNLAASLDLGPKPITLQGEELLPFMVNVKREPVNTLHKYPLFKSILLEKIILHYSSGKLLQSPSNSTIIDLAFSTIACQTPTLIHSRTSIAGFKLSKSALLGAKTTLRNLAKYEFYYKFYFLGASQMLANSTVNLQGFAPPLSMAKKPLTSTKSQTKHCLPQTHNKLFRLLSLPKKTKLISTAFPIKNVFVFNELDNLDYDAFSNLAGLEILFVNRDLPMFVCNNKP